MSAYYFANVKITDHMCLAAHTDDSIDTALILACRTQAPPQVAAGLTSSQNLADIHGTSPLTPTCTFCEDATITKVFLHGSSMHAGACDSCATRWEATSGRPPQISTCPFCNETVERMVQLTLSDDDCAPFVRSEHVGP